MNKLINFLSGFKILEEVDSPINGHIMVKSDLAWGTYIQAAGLTQSGGVVESIWRETLRQISNRQLPVESSLILGLGGGSAAKIIRKIWPKSKMVGIDLDPLMIELGSKYLALGNSKTQIIIEDAYEYLKSNTKKYDLICVDLYNGDKFPKKFEDEKFLRAVGRRMSKKSLVIFNRLYYGDKRGDAVRFMKKLENLFKNVEAFYPEANVMYIATN